MYFIDSLFEDKGHATIMLSPYHCHLNEISLIWNNENQSRFKTTESAKIKIRKNDTSDVKTFDLATAILKAIHAAAIVHHTFPATKQIIT
jgi:hypothetical protein